MADATLLDAPTDQKTGADNAANDGTKSDEGKPAAAGNAGKADAKAPPAGDQKPPADSAKPEDSTDKAPKAPEKYADPKMPEGFGLDEAVKAKFDADAKAMNLSQEHYQTLIDRHVEVAQAQMQKTMAQFETTKTEWRDASVKALGPNYEKELATASKGIDRAFPDAAENKAFREMMKETGLGNWLPMVRLCTFIGKSLSEDTFVDGKPDGKAGKSLADRIYGSDQAK